MRTFSLLMLVLAAPLAQAQHHDHSNHVAASDTADGPTGLTADEMAGLLAGAGLGMARPAEMHRYPGPLHVLELADSIDLSDDQRAEAEAIRARMLAAVRPLGAQLVEVERHLHAAFASGAITPEQITRMTVHAADLRARIRAAHLTAHLDMRAAMTDPQVETYIRLRGYR